MLSFVSKFWNYFVSSGSCYDYRFFCFVLTFHRTYHITIPARYRNKLFKGCSISVVEDFQHDLWEYFLHSAIKTMVRVCRNSIFNCFSSSSMQRKKELSLDKLVVSWCCVHWKIQQCISMLWNFRNSVIAWIVSLSCTCIKTCVYMYVYMCTWQKDFYVIPNMN